MSNLSNRNALEKEPQKRQKLIEEMDKLPAEGLKKDYEGRGRLFAEDMGDGETVNSSQGLNLFCPWNEKFVDDLSVAVTQLVSAET